MANKVIRVKLDEIDKAVKELEKYRQSTLTKIYKFSIRLGEEIADIAQSGFNGATMDDVVGGSTRSPSVTMSVTAKGSIISVIANGEDAVWVEFGAGVYHNGSAGSSPHPEGARLGFTIGSYGKGYGKGKAWGYYDNGVLTITRGTPASMPMYNAMKDVVAKAEQIAKEVWG